MVVLVSVVYVIASLVANYTKKPPFKVVMPKMTTNGVYAIALEDKTVYVIHYNVAHVRLPTESIFEDPLRAEDCLERIKEYDTIWNKK